MKRAVFFLLFALFASAVPASRPHRLKVGLVLGGGGAKGAAEVGVLKVLEEEEIPVDYIAGTSIGALVGGLYSTGYRADFLRSLFRHCDWAALFSDYAVEHRRKFLSSDAGRTYIFGLPLPFQRTDADGAASFSPGLVEGRNISALLQELTAKYKKSRRFSRLPIPFACVAVDLRTLEERVLTEGVLWRAMRASMSIPGIFMPVEWGGAQLIDGGALNNLPVDVVRQMGADIVICVDLQQREEDVTEVSFFARLGDMLMGQARDRYVTNRLDADFYIHPQIPYGPLHFSRSATDEMYQLGYAAADALRPQLRDLKRYLLEPTRLRPQFPRVVTADSVRSQPALP
ncbi:MAG: patatin-like phospholipase family protein [Alloprevotella sp.]|nr:patatin-like phospholipase family protein [Alloprevotella sp.]